jgi:hypothetical protein
MSTSRLVTPGIANYTICTSSTRPASPVEGALIYETDTDKFLQYTTATTGWTPPWNMPWGQVAAVAYGGANPATLTTIVDIAGLTVTFTAVTNRLYKAWCTLNMSSSVTGDVAVLHLNIDANATFARGFATVNNASQVSAYACRPSFTLTTGSRVIKAQAYRNTGTGNITAFTSDGCFIVVEDIGPSAAPA